MVLLSFLLKFHVEMEHYLSKKTPLTDWSLFFVVLKRLLTKIRVVVVLECLY